MSFYENRFTLPVRFRDFIETDGKVATAFKEMLEVHPNTSVEYSDAMKQLSGINKILSSKRIVAIKLTKKRINDYVKDSIKHSRSSSQGRVTCKDLFTQFVRNKEVNSSFDETVKDFALACDKLKIANDVIKCIRYDLSENDLNKTTDHFVQMGLCNQRAKKTRRGRIPIKPILDGIQNEIEGKKNLKKKKKKLIGAVIENLNKTNNFNDLVSIKGSMLGIPNMQRRMSSSSIKNSLSIRNPREGTEPSLKFGDEYLLSHICRGDLEYVFGNLSINRSIFQDEQDNMRELSQKMLNSTSYNRIFEGNTIEFSFKGQ
jgi:hypothetical protein